MSFEGVLLVGEKSFQVKSLSVSLTRPTDAQGKPGPEMYTMLEVCINSLKGGQLFWELYETSPHATINGEISFIPSNGTQCLKNFTFKNASCVPAVESSESQGSPPKMTKLTITTREFTYADIDMPDF